MYTVPLNCGWNWVIVDIVCYVITFLFLYFNSEDITNIISINYYKSNDLTASLAVATVLWPQFGPEITHIYAKSYCVYAMFRWRHLRTGILRTSSMKGHFCQSLTSYWEAVTCSEECLSCESRSSMSVKHWSLLATVRREKISCLLSERSC